jgi:hypothetical protein
MNQVTILVPKDRDLEKFLTEYSNEFDSEYLKFLIHYVIEGLSKVIINPKSADEKNVLLSRMYISIHSKNDVIINEKKHREHINLLRSDKIDIVRRRSFTKYTDETIGVLYRKNYKQGVNSFGYRLNPRFYGKKLELHTLTNYRLINKFREYYTTIHPIVENGKYKFLKKFFDPKKLHIDLDEAIKLCESRKGLHKSKSKYLNEMVQIVDLHNGIYRIYHKMKTDGRVHSNLTRLPKVYRRFIKYNDSALVEVDLSNSIIYFLSMLLSNKLNLKLINKFSLLHIFVKSLPSLDNNEIELMQTTAINGSFYDDFITQYQKVYNADDIRIMFENDNDEIFNDSFEHLRKVVKTKILAMIFAKSKDYKIEQEIFNSKFPQILNAINKFKDTYGHEKLSHSLLQLEALFIVDKAGRSFNHKHWRKAPLFTLHDCLITTIDHKKKLKICMEDAFIDSIGISPNMKTKEWV